MMTLDFTLDKMGTNVPLRLLLSKEKYYISKALLKLAIFYPKPLFENRLVGRRVAVKEGNGEISYRLL